MASYADYKDAVVEQTGSLKGNYFLVGRYAVVITAVIFKEGFKGIFTFIEANILVSQPDLSVPLEIGETYPQAGQNRSQTLRWDIKYPTMPANNFRNFLNAAVFAMYDEATATQILADPKQVSEFQDSIYQQNCVAGYPLYLVVEPTPKVHSDGTFSLHKWAPYTGQLGPLPGQE